MPKATLLPLLSSTNPAVVRMTLWELRNQHLEPDDISPLLTNSLPLARVAGLVALLHIGSTAAMDRIVAMLRDPDKRLRWAARQNLRGLSGKKVGAKAAAWEKWRAENRETFAPAAPGPPALGER